MTLLLDEAHVFCDRDPISGRHVLGSAVSFERKSLPQGDFELIFQDGQGFLFRHEDDDGDIAPVSDFMDAEVRATRANSGENPPAHDFEITWKDSGRNIPSTIAHARRRALRTVVVRVPPVGLGLKLPCAHFARAKHGAGFRIMFSVQGLHSALNLSQFRGRSSVWANHMWDSFVKACASRWSLGPEHWAKSREYRTQKHTARPPDTNRTLPYHAMSTFALLVLLFQWSFRCSAEGGFAKASDAQCADAALQGLLLIVPDTHFAFCEKVDWQSSWPRFLWEGARVVVEAKNNQLQLCKLEEPLCGTFGSGRVAQGRSAALALS